MKRMALRGRVLAAAVLIIASVAGLYGSKSMLPETRRGALTPEQEGPAGELQRERAATSRDPPAPSSIRSQVAEQERSARALQPEPAVIPSSSNRTTTPHIRSKAQFKATCQASGVWYKLCAQGFTDQAQRLLSSPADGFSLLQIGAHAGWEATDPFTVGITSFLQTLDPEQRQKITYTFVEASPTNFAVLEENVKGHSSLCQMKTLNVGVVPTSGKEDEKLTFYTISSDIDVLTGFDKRTNKTLPPWATQLSSFSRQNILKHAAQWRKAGVNIEDYIEEIEISTMTFTQLLLEASSESTTLLVLIDTEGMDCKIVESLLASSEAPDFLVYEHRHCDDATTRQHLSTTLGYAQVEQLDTNNVLAVKVNVTQKQFVAYP